MDKYNFGVDNFLKIATNNIKRLYIDLFSLQSVEKVQERILFR